MAGKPGKAPLCQRSMLGFGWDFSKGFCSLKAISGTLRTQAKSSDADRRGGLQNQGLTHRWRLSSTSSPPQRVLGRQSLRECTFDLSGPTLCSGSLPWLLWPRKKRMLQTEYRSDKRKRLSGNLQPARITILSSGQGRRLPWDGESALRIQSGKGKTYGKKNTGLKTEASPLREVGGLSQGICSKILPLDPTPEHRPGLGCYCPGEKASWTTSVLLPS